MAEGVLFDLDGVLADSRETITRCAARALADTGHGERAPEELEWIIGPPTRVGFARLVGADADSPQVEAVVRRYRDLYADALHETSSFPGVPEAVRALAEHRRLGVATSKPARFAGPVLEAIGLADAFDVVAGASLSGTVEKAETVADALARLGGAVALVGDTRYDVEAALANGLDAVGVTWGIGSRSELEDAGASAVVDDPAELVALLLSGPPPESCRATPPTGG